MLKKLFVITLLLFLVVGIVSAADMNNSANDTLSIDENNNDEIVKIQDNEVIKEKAQSTVTVKFINEVTGEEIGSISNTLSEGISWSFTMKKFDNMIANHKTFKLDGYKYTFTHWSGENGIVDSTQRFTCTGEDYTVTYYANYDKELLGKLTFQLIDEHGHNGHKMNYTDEADYAYTFKDPVDVEEGYKFLYYEDAETGETYNPGDVYSILYSEFKGMEKTVVINAIYEKIPENNTENETDINNTTIENETDDPIDNPTDNNNTENQTIKHDSKDDNVTVALKNHRTGNSFILIAIAVVIIIAVYVLEKQKKL